MICALISVEYLLAVSYQTGWIVIRYNGYLQFLAMNINDVQKFSVIWFCIQRLIGELKQSKQRGKTTMKNSQKTTDKKIPTPQAGRL